jgi:hypothetical protein
MTFQIKIEEFDYSSIKRNAFYLPPIPWKWTLTKSGKVIGFGYCHTEEDANRMASQSLNNFKKPQYTEHSKN